MLFLNWLSVSRRKVCGVAGVIATPTVPAPAAEPPPVPTPVPAPTPTTVAGGRDPVEPDCAPCPEDAPVVEPVVPEAPGRPDELSPVPDAGRFSPTVPVQAPNCTSPIAVARTRASADGAGVAGLARSGTRRFVIVTSSGQRAKEEWSTGSPTGMADRDGQSISQRNPASEAPHILKQEGLIPPLPSLRVLAAAPDQPGRVPHGCAEKRTRSSGFEASIRMGRAGVMWGDDEVDPGPLALRMAGPR